MPSYSNLRKGQEIIFFFHFSHGLDLHVGLYKLYFEKIMVECISRPIPTSKKKKKSKKGDFCALFARERGGGEIKTPSAFIKKGGGGCKPQASLF